MFHLYILYVAYRRALYHRRCSLATPLYKHTVLSACILFFGNSDKQMTKQYQCIFMWCIYEFTESASIKNQKKSHGIHQARQRAYFSVLCDGRQRPAPMSYKRFLGFLKSTLCDFTPFFSFLKHLMMLLVQIFFRASFLHLIKDTDNICLSCSSRRSLLNNVVLFCINYICWCCLYTALYHRTAVTLATPFTSFSLCTYACMIVRIPYATQ